MMTPLHIRIFFFDPPIFIFTRQMGIPRRYSDINVNQKYILAEKGDSHDNSGHSAKAYLRHKSHWQVSGNEIQCIVVYTSDFMWD
jgi:hypothetical protein